jgi:hypothetical protein
MIDYYRLDESRNRDCDYIISVNFVTFLILTKINKLEEARRYIEINKKMIEAVLEEEISKAEKVSLSVILESSPT